MTLLGKSCLMNTGDKKHGNKPLGVHQKNQKNERTLIAICNTRLPGCNKSISRKSKMRLLHGRDPLLRHGAENTQKII